MQSDSPTITVRYWAGARAAAGRAEENLPWDGGTRAALQRQLGSGRPDLERVLRLCSFLVDGVATPAEAPLAAGCVVEVLPPFAGG